MREYTEYHTIYSRQSDLAVLLPFRVRNCSASFPNLSSTSTIRTYGLCLVACILLTACVGQATSDDPSVFMVLMKWTPFLASGFVWNIIIGVLAMAIGTVGGILLGIGQLSTFRISRTSAWLFTQALRNSPWLVLLFYCMYLLPFQVTLFGVQVPLPGWFKATFGFALPVMAYVSEIVRGGVQSIPSGQWESAEALGFTRKQTMWMIILPQCIKRMLPPWMNLYAFVTMATVLANIVGVTEGLTATREALAAESKSFLLLPMYAYILLWFFVYCYPIARTTTWLERKWAVRG